MGDEELVERTLRPQFLREYIGQDKVKDQLQIFIEAAQIRVHGPAPHHAFLLPQ